jgi:hypothetical protein
MILILFVMHVPSTIAQLRNFPKSWSSGLFKLLKQYDPEFSTVDCDVDRVLNDTIASLGDRTVLNYFYIVNGDSDSLSFYRLLSCARSLVDLCLLIDAMSSEHACLFILFTSSLLCFRFCKYPSPTCPLCRKSWLWEHFLSCPRLRSHPVDPSPGTLREFKD